MAMVSAIQEAQKDNVRSFNNYMLKVLEVSIATITNCFDLICMLVSSSVTSSAFIQCSPASNCFKVFHPRLLLLLIMLLQTKTGK